MCSQPPGPRKPHERKEVMESTKVKINQALKSLAIIGIGSFLLSGCLTSKEESSYSSDGASAYMTNEIDQMGQSYGQIPEAGSGIAAAKTSASEINIPVNVSITGELVIDPYAYNADCTCFIRKANYTGTKGFERERVDSVVLFDTEGNTMNHWDKLAIGKIVHKRNVTHSKDAKVFDMRMDFTVDIKTDAGIKKGVWNGTMSGTLNGEPFKSGTITNITRTFENGKFQFPEAGSIEIERPVFQIRIEFLGDSKATVTITNKLNKRVRTLFVDKNYSETESVEKP